jgi:4-amino-4-deoxy-L-arabinose transferase-like glycosyltransferase
MRWLGWLVIAGAALMLLARSAAGPLMDPDEARFARTSVEMMRSGDQVVPRFAGQPRLAKPPLIHWIQSAVFRWVGATEWAARLHSALSTLGAILLVGWICRRRFGREGGLWGSAVLVTMPLVLAAGRVGTIDALLSVHVLAIVTLDLVDPEGGVRHRGACTGALLGLAFLAKGPVGVLLPLIGLLAGRTACGLDVLPTLRSSVHAVAAWCAVVLPWGVSLIRRVGWDAIQATVRGEALEAYLGGTTHVRPRWYYLEVAAVGFLPWIAPLVLGLGRALRMRRQPAARTAAYAGAALLGGFLFLSLGANKLPTYILPLAPLAAIVVTWELQQEMEHPSGRRLGSILLAGSMASTAVLLGLAGSARLDGRPRSLALAGAGIFGVAALVAAWGMIRSRPRQVFAAAALSAGSFLLLAVVVWFPELAASRSAAGLIQAWPPLARSGRPVLTIEIKVPSLTFYLDRVVESIEEDQLPARLDRPDAPWIVLADVDLPRLPATVASRLNLVASWGKYRVFEEKSMLDGRSGGG